MVVCALHFLNLYFEALSCCTITTDALLILHLCLGYVQLHVLYIALTLPKRSLHVMIVLFCNTLYYSEVLFCPGTHQDLRLLGLFIKF